MSGHDSNQTRLRSSGFGRDQNGNGKRYDGLTLAEYQKRELRSAFFERWPHDTARSASRALGEPHQTVRNWLEGLTFPSGFKLLRIQRHLGLAFLARLDPEPDSELRLAAGILRRQAIEAEISRLSGLLADPAPARV